MAYCAICGAPITDPAAKFCVNCGAALPIGKTVEHPVSPRSPDGDVESANASAAVDRQRFKELLPPAVRTTRNKVGLGIWGFLLGLQLFVFGWRAFEGLPVVRRTDGTGSAAVLLWLAAASWGFIGCYARFQWWKSAALGIGLGWALYFGGLNLREAMVRHRFLVSAEKIDPVDAQAYREAGDDISKKNSISGKVVLAAMRIAPDWAVVYYWNDYTDILYDEKKQMLACASYVRPGPGPTQSFSRGDETQFEWLTINLTQAAAESPTKPFAFDDKRSASLADVLSRQGALVNTEAVKSMTDAEACAMTHKQLSAIKAFSESDEAYFVKALYLQ